MISITYNIIDSRVSTCNYSIPEEYKTRFDEDYYDKCVNLSTIITQKLINKSLKNQDGEYTVNVILHLLELYKNPPTEDSRYFFGQDYFIKQNRNDYYPILHFSSILFDDKIVGHRYSYIMDNSIWNHFVKIWEDNNSNRICIDEAAFSNAIENITNGIERQLYKLCVTKEYAELNARIMEQSYLVTFPGSIGHSEYVSPFVFHSESEVEQLTEKEFVNGNRKTIAEIKQRRWRILLVDDKANRSMAPFKPKSFDENDNLRWDCKLKIIKFWLDKFFSKANDVFIIRSNSDYSSLDDDTHMLIEYKETLKEAKEALKEKEYDIILLDYLLLEPKSKVHYGHELLDDIYKHHDIIDPLVDELKNRYKSTSESTGQCVPGNETTQDILNDIEATDGKFKDLLEYIKEEETLKNIYNSNLEPEEKLKELFYGLRKYKVGPYGRFFFMFISAYSSAVYERLLAEGLNQSEDYWHIAVGACPTNTPQLFLYNFIKLMERRIDDSGILELSSDAIYKLINKIYLRKEDDPKRDSIRKRANAHYQEVLSLQYHYRSILRDVEIPFGNNSSTFDTKGSVLMTDFIQKKVNLGGMLEHLTQLVHLTAFGTIRQWPEMWEEYIYFKAMFEKQLDEVSSKDFNTLCQNIENYILELKSQQQ